MGFLRLLEAIRNPVLDAIMQGITVLGDETVFLVLALLVFWCGSKKWGYYLMSIGFLGTILNQFLKLAFRIPRPWVRDPNFTIVEGARAGADGYSFPSGHTQSAVGTFGGIAHFTRYNWIRVVCWVLLILVPFSRMYLGVHTPADVAVSFIIATVLVFALKPLMDRSDRKPGLLYLLLLGMVVLAIGFVVYVECWPFPADMDAANYASGRENAYTLLGAVVGVNIVHYVDDQFLRFETKAPPLAQVLKLVLGLLVVLAVLEGLKVPLAALFGGHPAAEAVRYFLVVLVAGCVWPMTFGVLTDLAERFRRK